MQRRERIVAAAAGIQSKMIVKTRRLPPRMLLLLVLPMEALRAPCFYPRISQISRMKAVPTITISGASQLPMHSNGDRAKQLACIRCMVWFGLLFTVLPISCHRSTSPIES